MDRIFQRFIDTHFSELSGMTVDASIPLPEALINEILRTTLEENKTIKSIQVSVHAQNKVAADIKTTLLPWTLHLRLKLDKFVDLASYSSPKIRAWMENHRFLGSLGAFLHALPEGLKLYGDQIVFDLGSFLRTPEQERLLALVKAADIRTEEGKIILDVRAGVE